MIGSCSAATIAPTPSFHWKRNADVGHDHQEREQRRERALLRQLLADLRAHDLGAAQLAPPGRSPAAPRARPAPTALTSSPSCGSRRTSTSCDVPKLCTSASS